MPLTESNIEFEFGEDNVDQIGDEGFGYGLKDVDFIIRTAEKTILLEIKATISKPYDYLSDDLIEKFVEKARDTYTYLHLMDDVNRPLEFTAVIHFKTQIPDTPFLLTRQDVLKSKLTRQKRGPWKLTYIDDAYLICLEDLPNKYRSYSYSVT